VVRRIAPTATAGWAWNGGPSQSRGTTMFFFFSNKLGWAGSIAVSIVLSLLLYGLFRLFF
jgi:hypothetical protein